MYNIYISYCVCGFPKWFGILYHQRFMHGAVNDQHDQGILDMMKHDEGKLRAIVKSVRMYRTNKYTDQGC